MIFGLHLEVVLALAYAAFLVCLAFPKLSGKTAPGQPAPTAPRQADEPLAGISAH